MANLANLLATIAANVYTNHNNEVTAQMVKDAMGAIVSTMGQGGYIYKGLATTSTNPSSPDANVFYIATAAGTYTNFGGIVVNAGEVAILKGTGTSWSKDVTGAATAAKLTELELEVDKKVEQKGDDSDADLNVGDEYGNVILQLKGGEIRTKNFDSSKSVLSLDDDSNAELSVCDINGNVILQLKGGEIKTQNFDSYALGNRQIKFAAMGDSITSNYVTNTAGRVREILGVTYLKEDVSDGSPSSAGNVTTEFGNLACGWSTCEDIEESGVNVTPIHLLKCPDENAYDYPENTLSNQVRRLLQHTAPLGEDIQWTHPLTGETFTIDGATYGYGKGYTDDIPDIIYIASGTNDVDPVDDYETVIGQEYNELTRTTMASALRWAIETLKMNYPSTTIFVCTPIYRIGPDDRQRTWTLRRREIIIKICQWLGINVIDQTFDSGIGVPTADVNRDFTPYRRWLTLDGCHPNTEGREVSAQFIAGRIKAGYGALR